ncbi:MULTISPECIES: MATE family efflux transporter [unclassified Paenibacillus]|uniref:MATE family efflux transporter n=1 Tax=unclassified Paenibacillus TaxID=185978 RepID=UPI002406F53B|nr:MULTISPECIES: MATE family efflux transporter [unclassified Paenibacillus]MDF9840811.1 putative MATE family efflux protein [Paenibacillus sp. PastF-2]MDF9847394.1 putative MATE family efflux protein [Paenibacillus sp. PastM-2]MDF9854028.1 putative MATE family efflux protein [Paenibacillus sp. PastF-1]MDH6479301.1 putative MATE family efflux protein [Paenibacillus sp. PastH-2]MDH6506964.1 putative MATE family efflux protein [Paenibacillus sp. PastM-3]
MPEPGVKVKVQGKQGNRLLDKYFSGDTMDYRQMISLFIPILVDQAFVVGLNLVNTAMISSSGVAAISAVNMIDSLNIFLISVFIAVSTGGTVVVAQYKGSGNDLMVSKATAGAVSSVSLMALFIGLFGIVFHGPLLNLLFGAASPDVMANARTYLIGSSLSYLGIAVVEAVCGALRGIGRARASLVLSLIMNLIYVLLNFVFINGLHMGVFGMTIAVNASRYFAAVCALIYLFRMDSTLHVKFRDLLALNWSMLKRIMNIGLPFAAEQMFFNGGKILTQIFIVSLGTYAIATNAITSTLAGVMQIPANALSLTLITVVGQCMGSRNVRDARKFVKSFLVLSSASYVLMALLIFPAFHPLVSLFHPPAEIIDDIFLVFLINSIAQIPLWSVSFITPSALRAAGDSKFTSMVSMLSMWLFRVVLGYLLGIQFGMGIVGVWLAMNCEWGVRGFIFMRRFLGDKWLQHKVI